MRASLKFFTSAVSVSQMKCRRKTFSVILKPPFAAESLWSMIPNRTIKFSSACRIQIESLDVFHNPSLKLLLGGLKRLPEIWAAVRCSDDGNYNSVSAAQGKSGTISIRRKIGGADHRPRISSHTFPLSPCILMQV